MFLGQQQKYVFLKRTFTFSRPFFFPTILLGMRDSPTQWSFWGVIFTSHILFLLSFFPFPVHLCMEMLLKCVFASRSKLREREREMKKGSSFLDQNDTPFFTHSLLSRTYSSTILGTEGEEQIFLSEREMNKKGPRTSQEEEEEKRKLMERRKETSRVSHFSRPPLRSLSPSICSSCHSLFIQYYVLERGALYLRRRKLQNTSLRRSEGGRRKIGSHVPLLLGLSLHLPLFVVRISPYIWYLVHHMITS